MKVLMVCLGNICRSPLAEGILRHKSQEKGLNWHIESAGTGAWHVGQAPDPRSQRVAKQHGIDISKQRAQQFSPYHIEMFDLIFAMDSSNYQDIIRHAKTDAEKNKIQLIMNMVEPGMNKAVPDPYYDDHLYATVYQMLDEACDNIISKYAINN
ncbi:MAG TPA: low molecular weight protein-tyrosine-phosphatase [Chitinophagales bacterium]|nr:low molecular weight protein-tyrosine-phosphatase [Chitinophagales bacterium]HMX04808.1 low molecular weight protein-tyrosine-phosphatase [Chitinophagales bacterium]HMZ89918.1 low molecular weight protein-tyrosine-phosphatase [Chitinophagales bacterium]HNA58183.1 low molecular weight protein-tyrosine-phosphatase [Chitinophagales bacterium]HNE47333.1 low molecular weight protein-tyrosine-phosphatase [Chitinophagales bacterium]